MDTNGVTASWIPLLVSVISPKASDIQDIFLLLCPSYAIQRVTLVTSVNETLLKFNINHLENQLQLYLYGDPSINNSHNKKILLSKITFIKETQRFAT